MGININGEDLNRLGFTVGTVLISKSLADFKVMSEDRKWEHINIDFKDERNKDKGNIQ